MYGLHGLPRYKMRFSNELQQVLHGIGKDRIGKEIKHSSEKRYSHGVIKWLNK